MNALFQQELSVERMMLVTSIGYVGLLMLLLMRRWIKGAWGKRRARIALAKANPNQEASTPRGLAGQAVAPVITQAGALASSAPRSSPEVAQATQPATQPAARSAASTVPAMTLAVVPTNKPTATVVVETHHVEPEPTANGTPAGAAPWFNPARRRPRPAREHEDTVLSPQSLLDRANEHLAAGAQEEAATQLRLCVRLASKLKEPTIEAVARLELGDLARASGDLTMACEHWQLARSLFADLKRPAEATAAEVRMENAGCPTDWVLTQF